MSISCLLFLNSELPDHVILDMDGDAVTYPFECPFEEGHGGWWDGCFDDVPPDLPGHHYLFGLPAYNPIQKAYRKHRDPEWYAETLESLRLRTAYLRKIMEMSGEEPLYIELHSDHRLTEDDLAQVRVIDLDRLDFTAGNEPGEFTFEVNRFYRFVRGSPVPGE